MDRTQVANGPALGDALDAGIGRVGRIAVHGLVPSWSRGGGGRRLQSFPPVSMVTDSGIHTRTSGISADRCDFLPAVLSTLGPRTQLLRPLSRQCCPSALQFVNTGNPVKHTPKIYFLWYGSWSTLSPNTMAILTDFGNSITQTPWWNIQTVCWAVTNDFLTVTALMQIEVMIIWDAGITSGRLSTACAQTYYDSTGNCTNAIPYGGAATDTGYSQGEKASERESILILPGEEMSSFSLSLYIFTIRIPVCMFICIRIRILFMPGHMHRTRACREDTFDQQGGQRGVPRTAAGDAPVRHERNLPAAGLSRRHPPRYHRLLHDYVRISFVLHAIHGAVPLRVHRRDVAVPRELLRAANAKR